MNKYFFSFIILSTVLWGCQQTPEISQWRGPGRTGVYNETNLLKQWPEEGPEMLWALDSLPKGNSSVSVYDDMIYLTGLSDTMDVLIAVDMKGNLKWTKPYGRAWNASFPESRCTPTIEDGKIYLTSGLGDVACLEAGTGKVIWQIKASEKFEGIFGDWGIAESPLLYNDYLIYTPGGPKTTMVALDKNTGETVWMSESLNDEPAYVSPLLVEMNGHHIVVSVTKLFVFGVDAETGELLWKFDYGKYKDPDYWNIQTNTPVFADGNIFVTNGYDHKSVLLKLAEDASSVELQYVDTVLDVHHGGAVRLGNYIYGSNWEHNRMGRWVCLDWTTGKVTYETEWYNKGSIISAEGMLYCYDEKTGHVGLVKADPQKFEVISEFEITHGTGPHWTHPVIKDGILYIRHTDALMAFNIKAN